jgi:hypothetical protein
MTVGSVTVGFAQANRRLYRLLNAYLYRYNIRHSGSSALLWAARHGQPYGLCSAYLGVRNGSIQWVLHEVMYYTPILYSARLYTEYELLLIA